MDSIDEEFFNSVRYQVRKDKVNRRILIYITTGGPLDFQKRLIASLPMGRTTDSQIDEFIINHREGEIK